MFFTLNEFSWLELIRLNTDGVARNRDPGSSSYRSKITTQAMQRATSVTADMDIGTNIPC